MMKIKGKEYPICLYKFMLHDLVADRFEAVREMLGVKTNVDALTIIINHTYGELLEFKKQLEEEKLDTLEPIQTSIINEQLDLSKKIQEEDTDVLKQLADPDHEC